MTKRAFVLSMFLLIGGSALSACTSGRAPDAYRAGSDEALKASRTSKEVCVASCNDGFDRCGDTKASHERLEGSNGLFGASADCRSTLTKCLQSCKGL